MAQRDRSDIISSLGAKGFVLDTNGNPDHDYYTYFYNGQQWPVYTKVSRGKSYKTIQVELLKKMARQVKLTLPQFLQLVDCGLSGPDYLTLLQSLDVIPPGK